MPSTSKPRSGSLQFWPRCRAKSILPSVNWDAVQKAAKDHKGILGFIGYKVGMVRILARDLTPHSMTKNKQIIVPASVIECPPMKIFSVRFYNNNQVATEVIADNLDKELKRVMPLPKKHSKKIEDVEKEISKYDDIRIIVFSMVKKTSIKKTPDIAEIGLNGSMEEKLSLAKQLMEKEIAVDSILAKNQLVDIRGITKGRGTEGPVRRFGIAFRQHKSEKGVRKAGSLGPWKPSRLSFRTPLMGQVGFFTRPQYNSRVISLDHDTNKINQKGGFHHYGMLHNHYVLVKGSVNGPAKRVILLTAASRPSKGTVKENFEIVSILK